MMAVCWGAGRPGPPGVDGTRPPGTGGAPGREPAPGPDTVVAPFELEEAAAGRGARRDGGPAVRSAALLGIGGSGGGVARGGVAVGTGGGSVARRGILVATGAGPRGFLA